MYSRMLDTMESKDEQKKALAGVDFKPRFKSHQQDCRFSQYCNLSADEMMEVVRDEVFLHFRSLSDSGSLLGEFMKDARLEVVKPNLLVKAVEMIKLLPLDRGDTKGDLYEYLLSKLTAIPADINKTTYILVFLKPNICAQGNSLRTNRDLIHAINTPNTENTSLLKIYEVSGKNLLILVLCPSIIAINNSAHVSIKNQSNKPLIECQRAFLDLVAASAS